MQGIVIRCGAQNCFSTPPVNAVSIQQQVETLCDWSDKQGRDPSSTTTPQLPDFLTFLFKDKQFAPSSIAGYWTTVVNTLEKVTGARPTDDHLLFLPAFFHSMRSNGPIHGWDLAFVLHAVHSAPFEPLAQASL